MSNQPAAPAASSMSITKICIRCSNDYNGKAETAQAWLDSICLYLLVNQALYHDDVRKITYALSYMKKGSAATWAEVHWQNGFATQFFGTFNNFVADFEKSFCSNNVQMEAMNWLTTTCITTGEQLQEYTNHFKLNIVSAKFDETKDTITLISYYSAGIPVGLM